MDDLKQCTRCLRRKPRSEFSRHARKRDGLRSNCKECVRGFERLSPAERERAKGCAAAVAKMWRDNGLKRCQRCRRLRPLEAFTAHPATFDGMQPQCRECQSKRYATYYKETTEERRAYSREWQRARRAGG